MCFLDEVDCIAEVDNVEVREVVATPGDLRLLDGHPCVPQRMSVPYRSPNQSGYETYPLALSAGHRQALRQVTEASTPHSNSVHPSNRTRRW